MTVRDDLLKLIRQGSQALEPLPTGEAADLKPLHNIGAVLFDVYGTMFISSSGEPATGKRETEEAAFRQVMLDAGLELRTRETACVNRLHEMIAAFHERSRKEGIDYPEVDIIEVWRRTLTALQQSGDLAGDTGNVDLEMLSLGYELATNPVWPMPGATECLTELTSRGIILGLISNAQWFTPLLFPALLGGEPDALGIGADLQFWSWRTGLAKPGEHLFRMAADAFRRRGIEASQVLIVGNDMLNDVVPAASVGFRTALFAGDRRSFRRRADDPRTAGVTPDIVLIHLRQLLSCIRCTPES